MAKKENGKDIANRLAEGFADLEAEQKLLEQREVRQAELEKELKDKQAAFGAKVDDINRKLAKEQNELEYELAVLKKDKAEIAAQSDLNAVREARLDKATVSIKKEKEGAEEAIKELRRQKKDRVLDMQRIVSEKADMEARARRLDERENGVKGLELVKAELDEYKIELDKRVVVLDSKTEEIAAIKADNKTAKESFAAKQAELDVFEKLLGKREAEIRARERKVKELEKNSK